MMHSDRRHGRVLRLLSVLVVAAFGIGLASTAFGDDDEDSQKTYWQEKYRNLRQEVAEVRNRLEVNRRAISNARQRGYPRGAERDKLYQWVAEDEARLPELEEQLENFEADARREGAMPGWFRDLGDEDVKVEGATEEERLRGQSADDDAAAASPADDAGDADEDAAKNDDEDEFRKKPRPAARRNDAVRDAEDAF